MRRRLLHKKRYEPEHVRAAHVVGKRKGVGIHATGGLRAWAWAQEGYQEALETTAAMQE